MNCDACFKPIDGTPLLVPRSPTGVYRYHTSRACRASATRQAAVVFPQLSGRRGSRAR